MSQVATSQHRSGSTAGATSSSASSARQQSEAKSAQIQGEARPSSRSGKGSAPPAIELRGLVRRLRSGDRWLDVVDNIDLQVPAGQFLAVLGPSGSGKSTLLALIAGLDQPSEGEIYLDGEPVHRMSEDALARLRRSKVGFVFQSFQLLSNQTARENVQLPLELAGQRDAAARAEALLAQVGLAERSHHYPAQLSGGEQQRVALARAFATRPPILLADEPTGNLDGHTGEAVMSLLNELRREAGTTLVLVTHDPQVAQRADRRIVLRDGRIESDDATADDAAAKDAGADDLMPAEGPGSGPGHDVLPATAELGS